MKKLLLLLALALYVSLKSNANVLVRFDETVFEPNAVVFSMKFDTSYHMMTSGPIFTSIYLNNEDGTPVTTAEFTDSAYEVTHIIGGLPSGRIYKATLMMYYTGGVETREVYLSTSGPSGLLTLTLENSIFMVNNHLHVDLPFCEINIYDLVGKVLFHQQTGCDEWNMDLDLPKGTYIVLVKQHDETRAKKIVIQ